MECQAVVVVGDISQEVALLNLECQVDLVVAHHHHQEWVVRHGEAEVVPVVDSVVEAEETLGEWIAMEVAAVSVEEVEWIEVAEEDHEVAL